MSIEAVNWALGADVPVSSAKFILVVLANAADAEAFACFPSVEYLAGATSQDRKTVIANLKRLTEWGYIEDTGERVGRTKQIVVWQLVGPVADRIQPRANRPNNGTLEASQKRKGSENGTVPFFPGKSTNFPGKGSQKRYTDPFRETSGKDLSTPTGVEPDSAPLPDGARPAEPGEKASRTAPPPVPHQRIVELYHERLPMCPAVRDWTPQRQGLLRARWREDPKRQSLEWWARFFDYVSESDFLTGRTEPRDDRLPFFASLEWLLRPQRFARVREGFYHRVVER